MLADIEAGKVNTIITKDMSRLGRDYIDFGYYMERYFPEHGIRYIAVVDNFDTNVDGYTSDLAPFKALFKNMFYSGRVIQKRKKSVIMRVCGDWLSKQPQWIMVENPPILDKSILFSRENASYVVFSLFLTQFAPQRI